MFQRSKTSIVGTPGILRRFAPAVAAVAVIVLTLALGRWQLNRAEQKQGLAQAIAANRSEAPLDAKNLKQLLAQQQNQAQASEASASRVFAPSHLTGRAVELQGRFDPTRTVFVDNRPFNGIAGMLVVMPFISPLFERPILVLRGWVPRDPQNRNRLPGFIASAQQTLQAHWIDKPDTAYELGAFVPGPNERLWPNITRQRYEQWAGQPVEPLWLREGIIVDTTAMTKIGNTPDALAQMIQQWPMPDTGVAKHHGYAFQWFSLAGLTGILWVVFGWWRPRRKRLQAQPDQVLGR
jgi:surfeit locus 1 family protein